MAITLAVKAQTTYSLSFNVGDYSLNTSGGLLSVLSSKTDEREIGGPQSPALPYYPMRVLLPEGCTDFSYQVSFSDSLIMTGVTVAANALSHAIDSVPCQTQASTVSGPGHLHYNGIRRIGRYYYAYFLISPFSYDIQSHKLYFSSQVSVSMSNYQVPSGGSPAMADDTDIDLPTWFVNPGDASAYYPGTASPSLSTGGIDYLIISKESIISNFEYLRRWKSTKGLRVAVVRLESIYANYQGSTPQEKIKRCIEAYHAIGTRFVLLGGDESVVPAKYVRTSYSSYMTMTPCDLYYACFNGDYNWDGNNNGYCGEVDDGIDMKPQVYVTRLPVRTGQQILDYTNKLISYEKEPQQTNYLCRLLNNGKRAFGLSGTWGNSWSDDDSRYYLEKVYDEYIQPWWGGNKYYLYKDMSQLVGGSTYFLTAANLTTELNKGYHLVHGYSNGNATSWGVPGVYTTSDAYSQTNSNSSIILTCASHTNAFDSEPSLGEAFLRNAVGGAVACFASSRHGFGNGDGRITGSLLYDALFFRNLFRGIPRYNRNFGAVAAEAKRMLADDSETEITPNRWLQFCINPLGDPEMPIYTTNPSTFTGVTLGINGSSLTVSTGGVDRCTISVTSSSDYGLTYLQACKDETSHTFQNVCQNFTICVTRHDYVPYVLSLSLGDSPLDNNPLYVRSMGGNVFSVKVGDGTTVTRDFTNKVDREMTMMVSDVSTGRMVLTSRSDDGLFTIDASGWKRGVYAVRISSSDGIRTAKIHVK